LQEFFNLAAKLAHQPTVWPSEHLPASGTWFVAQGRSAIRTRRCTSLLLRANR